MSKTGNYSRRFFFSFCINWFYRIDKKCFQYFSYGFALKRVECFTQNARLKYKINNWRNKSVSSRENLFHKRVKKKNERKKNWNEDINQIEQCITCVNIMTSIANGSWSSPFSIVRATIQWILLSICAFIIIRALCAILHSISNLIKWFFNEFKWFYAVFCWDDIIKNAWACNHEYNYVRFITIYRKEISIKWLTMPHILVN